MLPSAHRNSGTRTYMSPSASLSLSGLDPHFGSASLDPDLLDATSPAWYPDSGEPHHTPVSPQHDQFSINFAPGFASHGVPTSHDALHSTSRSRLRFRNQPSPIASFRLCLPQRLLPSSLSPFEHLTITSWLPSELHRRLLCMTFRHLASLHAIARDLPLVVPARYLFLSHGRLIYGCHRYISIICSLLTVISSLSPLKL